MNRGGQWYVVHTQVHQESVAELNLRRQGFATYLPRYLRRRRHARRVETVARPLFPRYLFVALDIARHRWQSIHSTIGVSHLVQAGERPLPLPDGVVDEIKARETNEGWVALGLPAGVRPGSDVRLIEGIFSECQGTLERLVDERRVTILMRLLGREVRVNAPAASVGTV